MWIRSTRFFITLTPSSTITAVDLSRKQIKFANKQRKNLKLSNIKFVQGDALKINKQFHTKFDRIFSIESAFHYNRPLFFNHVNHLLQDDGIFVISDIMLSNTYISTYASRLFLRVFSDFLFIPYTNLISVNEWKKQLQNELTIVETWDITHQTFIPYYRHFFSIYIKNKKLPEWISDTLISYFSNNQHFSYVIAVCKKLN